MQPAVNDAAVLCNLDQAVFQIPLCIQADSTRHLKATWFGASHRENASNPEYMSSGPTFLMLATRSYGECGSRRAHSLG